MSETTKILVISDVHGRMRDLRCVLQNETADAMFYLGDGLYDLNGALELNKTPVPYPIYRVAGNCDVGYQEPTEGMAPFAGAAVLNESVIYLPQVGSTNAWAKENIAQFGPVGAVYTTDQTAGRGRLGRGWVDAPGKGLYYTAVIKTDLAQPSTLPLFASLAVCDALKQRYGIDCQIKWPNDLLMNGKKIVGILCEVAPDGHSLVVGIGINLAQPQEYFDMAGLPHGTSLLLQGVNVDLDTDPEWLAQYMTDFGFDRALYTYEEQGLAPYREQYKARCVNLGRRVTYDGGAGIAKDIDEEGRLVVHDESGDTHVFTGEVSVKGIYGAV